jgi:hypothetical protein
MRFAIGLKQKETRTMTAMAAPNVSTRFGPVEPKTRPGNTRAGMTDIAPAGATPATACAKTGKKESFRRLRPSTGERGVMKRSPRADTVTNFPSMGTLALLMRGHK